MKQMQNSQIKSQNRSSEHFTNGNWWSFLFIYCQITTFWCQARLNNWMHRGSKYQTSLVCKWPNAVRLLNGLEFGHHSKSRLKCQIFWYFRALAWDSPTFKLYYLSPWLGVFQWKTMLVEKTVRVELGESRPWWPSHSPIKGTMSWLWATLRINIP